MWELAVMGDELAASFPDQVTVAAAHGLGYVEVRSLGGRNVLDLTPAELAAARALGTANIRIFSFYVPGGEVGRHRAEVIRRLRALADLAGEAGVRLGLENEVGVYGDVPCRLADILAAVAAPTLTFTFDPANFVRAGVRPAAAWPLLLPWVGCVHIKDARFDGSHHTPGEGDGEIPALLAALRARGYRGFLTLEPHLAAAGSHGGFTGPELFATALGALRALLAAA